MTQTRHFAEELTKLAFKVNAPPVLTSAFGKTTKGVVAKPLTKVEMPAIKTPQASATGSVPASGKIQGVKLDPARSNTPPPPVHGGSNVQ